MSGDPRPAEVSEDPAHDRGSPGERRSATWLPFLLYGLFAYLLTGLGAATERLRSDLGVSRAVVGLHATAFAAGIVLGGLAGHRLSRRLGRGRAAVAGAVGMAAGTALLAAGRTPPVTLAGTLAMGVSGSLVLIVAPAFLADRHGSRTGAVLARANALASLCATVAPFLVGAAVAMGVGWRAAPAPAAGAVALFTLGLAGGRAAGGGLLRHVEGLTLLRAGLVVSVLGFLVFWMAGALAPALVGLAVAGLGVAMLYPLSLARAIAAAAGRTDLASGRAALGAGVAIGVAPFALGWLADTNGVHSAYLVVPLLAAGAWATSALAARTPPAGWGSGEGGLPPPCTRRGGAGSPTCPLPRT